MRDNALVDSFNAAVKVERVHRAVYPAREMAREDIAWYIGIRYNYKRLHSALGYQTPQEIHDDTWTGSSQHEMTQIKLSGKCRADQWIRPQPRSDIRATAAPRERNHRQ